MSYDKYTKTMFIIGTKVRLSKFENQLFNQAIGSDNYKTVDLAFRKKGGTSEEDEDEYEEDEDEDEYEEDEEEGIVINTKKEYDTMFDEYEIKNLFIIGQQWIDALPSSIHKFNNYENQILYIRDSNISDFPKLKDGETHVMENCWILCVDNYFKFTVEEKAIMHNNNWDFNDINVFGLPGNDRWTSQLVIMNDSGNVDHSADYADYDNDEDYYYNSEEATEKEKRQRKFRIEHDEDESLDNYQMYHNSLNNVLFMMDPAYKKKLSKYEKWFEFDKNEYEGSKRWTSIGKTYIIEEDDYNNIFTSGEYKIKELYIIGLELTELPSSIHDSKDLNLIYMRDTKITKFPPVEEGKENIMKRLNYLGVENNFEFTPEELSILYKDHWKMSRKISWINKNIFSWKLNRKSLLKKKELVCINEEGKIVPVSTHLVPENKKINKFGFFTKKHARNSSQGSRKKEIEMSTKKQGFLNRLFTKKKRI
jgi:hypothetical protein